MIDIIEQMTENDVQARLIYNFEKTASVIFDNIYFFSDKDYEADFLMFKKTAKGYMTYEYEIKVTHSDFLKDAEKVLKHSNYKKGIKCPNYFYYICPEGVIQPDEVKDGYGLVWITPEKFIRKKMAKKLTSETSDPADGYRKMYFRYFEWKKKVLKGTINLKKIKRPRKAYKRRRRK